MPIYEYRCASGHVFDVIQSMSDEPVEACEQCGAPVERVFHPVAVHFKGSGFYSTDYAAKAAASGEGDSPPGESKDGKSESKSKSKGDSESKPATKSDKANGNRKGSSGD